MCQLQEWVKHKGLRVIVIFEGRDAAGKGGTIKAITERVSSRVFRLVALPAPSDREKSQMYIQRYMQHFPAAGEVVIFDRSWYNRAGVEVVMGFCTEKQRDRFLEVCPGIESLMVEGGIILIKFWLEVSDEEQKRRFEARIKDPLRQWKLSPMDLPSRERWYQYLACPRCHARGHRYPARTLVHRRLGQQAGRAPELHRAVAGARAPQEGATGQGEAPQRSNKGAYDDVASLKGRRFVEQRYWDYGCSASGAVRWNCSRHSGEATRWPPTLRRTHDAVERHAKGL